MTQGQKLFADLTSAIEDLHPIAVEGQAPGLSFDIQLYLLASIGAGLVSIQTIIAAIATHISDGTQ
jgi:hypothetical protein